MGEKEEQQVLPSLGGLADRVYDSISSIYHTTISQERSPVACAAVVAIETNALRLTIDLPPVTVPVVKLLFAAPLGQPLHFVEA
jgi:hypothetical protein